VWLIGGVAVCWTADMGGRPGGAFLRCADGKVRWGLFGAAGLLIRTPTMPVANRPPWHFLLQLRSPRSHEGGTWAIPGGALDEHETPEVGALREATEELGPLPGDLRVDGRYTDRLTTDWTYTTIIATVAESFQPQLNWETTDTRWVTTAEIDHLSLHPAFATSLPRLLPIANLPPPP